jgi:gliding motility-associated-like protein
MKGRDFLFIFLCLNVFPCFGQYFSAHYIAPAPWQYWHNACEFIVATDSDSLVTVDVRKSDGTFIVTLTASAGSPAVYRPVGIFRDFPRHPLNTVLDGAGIQFKGDREFSVNIRNVASDQLGTDVYIKGNASLTGLGDPGVGVSFRLGYYRDGPLPSEPPVYSVMALQDSTELKINGVGVARLNSGQSYLFRDRIGTLVETSKPCVMNTGAFLDAPGGCGDGTFDQIPPVSVLGKRYFVVRTQGNWISEQSTLVSTEDLTKVWINKFNSSGTYLNTDSLILQKAGDFFTFSNGDGAVAFSVAEIISDKRIAVFTGSAQSCEVDVSTSFPVSSPCNGSNFIETTRFKAYNQADLPYFCYVLLEDPNAPVDFNGMPLETRAGARRQIGASGMYIFTFNSSQLGNPQVISLSSPVRLHISIIQIGGGFSMSATFSNLIEQPVLKEPIYVKNGPCPVSSAILSVQTSIRDIQWFYNGAPIPGAVDRSFVATRSGLYHVRGFIPCGDFSESVPVAVLLDSIPKGVQMVKSCEYYQWEDSVYLQSGTYTRLLQTTDGCDSLAVLELEINTSTSFVQFESHCEKYTWPINGNTYRSSGIYLDTLMNHRGCDSVVSLNLTIHPSPITVQQEAGCESFYWKLNGQTLTQGGLYYDTLISHLGCDSIVMLDLSIYHRVIETSAIKACQSYTWPVNDKSYLQSGIYRDTLISHLGCDSILVLDLEIFQPDRQDVYVQVCQSYNWSVNGMSYDKTGIYSALFQNEHGCDSVVQLNLTILNSSASTTQIAVCDPYTWSVNGIKYNTSGIFQYIMPNHLGCDSVLTLDLTILPHYFARDTQRSCGSFTWSVNGVDYTHSGDYRVRLQTQFGCDSILDLHLRIDPEYHITDTISALNHYYWPVTRLFYDQEGIYTHYAQSSDGCDSVRVLILEIRKRGEVYIPNAFTPNGDGVNDRFVVYSSPEIKMISRLQIYDRWGELVFEQKDFPPNVDLYGWDGNFRDQPANPAVFACTVEWVDTEGDLHILAGDATLIR